MEFEFGAFRNPRVWLGRYRRIPGNEPTFHTTIDDAVRVRWTDQANDELLTAHMLPSNQSRSLGKTINDVKEENSGSRGGSFLINEYGQVICPIAGSSRRFWVGNIKGTPKFAHPVTHSHFSLMPEDTWACNDPWPLPYIGMAYNLSHDDTIYFRHQTDDGEEQSWLDGDYPELVKLLRSVRPWGAVRFIVNLHGAVVTKVEYNDGIWRPHFVGVLDYDCWYSKES